MFTGASPKEISGNNSAFTTDAATTALNERTVSMAETYRVRHAILEPSADITPGYEVVTVVTPDQKTISGLVRFFDNFSCRLIDASGKEHTFLREDVTSMERELRSIMPGKSLSGRAPSERDSHAPRQCSVRCTTRS